MAVVNELGLIVMDNMKELGGKVDRILSQQRGVDTCCIQKEEVNFNDGTGKIVLNETVRDKDIFILADIQNHNMTHEMFGYINHKTPPQHLYDIKNAIGAARGHASRITIVTPFLMDSRQDKAKKRETLSCAIHLQEFINLGVSGFVTFDAHNPAVQNAIPLNSFDNFYPTNMILKQFIEDHNFDTDNLMIIAPDLGAAERARNFRDRLGNKIEMGIFNKKRDYDNVTGGMNKIEEFDYLGSDLKGKSLLVTDDMLASGSTLLEVASEAKKRGAKEVNFASTYSLFTKGLETFQKAYDKGMFKKLYTTNLSYLSDELKNKEWLSIADCSEHLAKIISTINNHGETTKLRNGYQDIKNLIESKKELVEI